MLQRVDAKWTRKVDGELTFAGVLEEYYDEVVKEWGEEYQKKSLSDYNLRILPALKDHNSKRMADYTSEDFGEAIEAIQEAYRLKTMTGKGYDASTIQHYRHLIFHVVSAANANGLCQSILWGSIFELPVRPTGNQKGSAPETLERLKRSFSIKEEQHIADAIFTNPYQSGEDMGLLLMFGLGVRNAEACGANFGDIRPLFEGAKTYALWVYKTTELESNKVKASGKTRNADRVVPIPSKLLHFLQERRRHIEQQINAGLVVHPQGEVCEIDEMPIACVGEDYAKRCSAPKLTAAAREIFRKAGVERQILALIERELQDPTVVLVEKEPTAYLFRRNFATVLHILGFTVPEIHYLVGHDIENSSMVRNEFVNEDVLLELSRKMEMRPLFSNEDCPLVNTTRHMAFEDVSSITFQAPNEQGTLKILLASNEPSDAISVTIAHNAAAEEVCFVSNISKDHKNTINITRQYREGYQREKL